MTVERKSKKISLRRLAVLALPISAIGVLLYFNGVSLKAHALENEMIAAGRIEFLTIDPCRTDYDNPEMIGRYPIIDLRIIEDRKTVESLLKGLMPRLEAMPNMCAIAPRHAIRMIDEPERFFLICFECGLVEYSNGETGMIRIDLDSKEREDLFNQTIERLGMDGAPKFCNDFLPVLKEEPEALTE